MTDKPTDESTTDADTQGSAETDAATPRGAIFITTFLTVVILVFWFGTYILSLVRS